VLVGEKVVLDLPPLLGERGDVVVQRALPDVGRRAEELVGVVVQVGIGIGLADSAESGG